MNMNVNLNLNLKTARTTAAAATTTTNGKSHARYYMVDGLAATSQDLHQKQSCHGDSTREEGGGIRIISG